MDKLVDNGRDAPAPRGRTCASIPKNGPTPILSRSLQSSVFLVREYSINPKHRNGN
ncbi:hypothetical protein COLO4_06337 [Corchorus olitorius]|uniref:Uncharacterized protein n=1 Tax=Corchorus olitorius TaxID=93759 RepID=A0A1R3KNA7_9ROSI|nr:hypothetical protein COLO4_06337 [Corchorus olitorius]